MNIKILCSFKNYVVLKDLTTKYYWLYSYNEPLCYFDDDKRIHIVKDDLTITNMKHMKIFSDFIKDIIDSIK